MPVVADGVRDVLVESTAGMNRHHLHPPAHTQERQVHRVSGIEKGKFPRVAVVAPLGGALVRLLAVPLR